MPLPQDIGSLAQEVLNWYNKLSQLRTSGAGRIAIKAAEYGLKQAKLAQQAATGSQRGLTQLIGRGIGGGSSLAGISTPDFASYLTPQISAQYPGMARIINAPSPLDLLVKGIIDTMSAARTQPSGSRGVGPGPQVIQSASPDRHVAASRLRAQAAAPMPIARTPRSPFPPPYGRTGPFIPISQPTVPRRPTGSSIRRQ